MSDSHKRKSSSTPTLIDPKSKRAAYSCELKPSKWDINLDASPFPIQLHSRKALNGRVSIQWQDRMLPENCLTIRSRQITVVVPDVVSTSNKSSNSSSSSVSSSALGVPRSSPLYGCQARIPVTLWLDGQPYWFACSIDSFSVASFFHVLSCRQSMFSYRLGRPKSQSWLHSVLRSIDSEFTQDEDSDSDDELHDSSRSILSFFFLFFLVCCIEFVSPFCFLPSLQTPG
jgi:hypothetical protein